MTQRRLKKAESTRRAAATESRRANGRRKTTSETARTDSCLRAPPPWRRPRGKYAPGPRLFPRAGPFAARRELSFLSFFRRRALIRDSLAPRQPRGLSRCAALYQQSQAALGGAGRSGAAVSPSFFPLSNKETSTIEVIPMGQCAGPRRANRRRRQKRVKASPPRKMKNSMTSRKTRRRIAARSFGLSRKNRKKRRKRRKKRRVGPSGQRDGAAEPRHQSFGGLSSSASRWDWDRRCLRKAAFCASLASLSDSMAAKPTSSREDAKDWALSLAAASHFDALTSPLGDAVGAVGDRPRSKSRVAWRSARFAGRPVPSKLGFVWAEPKRALSQGASREVAGFAADRAALASFAARRRDRCCDALKRGLSDRPKIGRSGR